jgi:molybdopterin-biosynthesis enzyme MoeA-like protein
MAQVGGVMNEARMRMARLPAGAELVLNKVSAAPGFWIGNVIVMAGVPQIMQVMLDYVAPKLRTGAKMLSQSVRADCREGDIGTELGEIAVAHAGVIIGSYPFMDEQRGANTHVVVRSRDPQKLNAAVAAVEAMLTRVRTALAAAPTGR